MFRCALAQSYLGAITYNCGQDKMLRVSRATTVIVLVIAVTMPSTQLVSYPCQSSSAVQAGVQAEQLLPDVELTQAPDVVINGTVQQEFSWEHSALPNDGVVSLNWTHSSGTLIHIRTSLGFLLPESLDFIYFQQSFDWNGASRPSDAQLKINGSITCTGSFNSSEDILMFGVYAYLIDPLGNWGGIHGSLPVSVGPFAATVCDLDFFDIFGAFSDSGIVTLAVGLSPLHNFLSYNGTEPYRSYNGSVVASFSRLRLDVLIEDDEPTSEPLEPVFNETYGSSVRDIFPDTPAEYANASDRFVEMATDDQGMIYALVNSEPDYPYGYQNGHDFAWETLLKYDPQLNLVWTTRNTNLTWGYDIEAAGGYIYTTGIILRASGGGDVYVSKWTLDGYKVWDAFWDSGGREYGYSVAVAANNSVYVSVVTFPGYGRTGNSALLKLDGSGTILWSRTGGELGPIAHEMEFVGGELLFLYASSVNHVELLESSFVIEELAAADDFAVDDVGNIYTCDITHMPAEVNWDSVTGRACVFEKIGPSGNSLWNCSFSIIYSDVWYELLVSIALTPLRDGSLVALIGGEYSREYHLVMIEANGRYLRHRLVFANANHDWRVRDPYPYYMDEEMSMCSIDTGFVYLGATVLESGTWESDIRVLGYELSVHQSDSGPVIVAVVSSTSVLIVVAAVWYLRKPQQSPP